MALCINDEIKASCADKNLSSPPSQYCRTLCPKRSECPYIQQFNPSGSVEDIENQRVRFMTTSELYNEHPSYFFNGVDENGDFIDANWKVTHIIITGDPLKFHTESSSDFEHKWPCLIEIKEKLENGSTFVDAIHECKASLEDCFEEMTEMLEQKMPQYNDYVLYEMELGREMTTKERTQDILDVTKERNKIQRSHSKILDVLHRALTEGESALESLSVQNNDGIVRIVYSELRDIARRYADKSILIIDEFASPELIKMLVPDIEHQVLNVKKKMM